MISAGDNRPRLRINDGYDELLVQLHLKTPVELLPKILELDQEEVARRLEALLQEGLAHRDAGGHVRPTVMIILIGEAPRYLYASADVVAQTADAISGNLPKLRACYALLPGFRNIQFEAASLLILSDGLLDSWQIDRVEKDILAVDRPLRRGGRYYYALLERGPGSDVEPFGIYGNHSQSVGQLDLCLYGNQRYRSRNLVTLQSSDVSTLFGLPPGTTVSEAQSILCGDLLRRAEHPNEDIPSTRLKGLQTLGLITENGQAAVPILSTDDNRAIGEMADNFAPTLIHILQDSRKKLFRQYQASPYFDDGVSFQEFFIWWYHVFYTAVTNELAHRNIIVMPPFSTLTYLSRTT